MRMMATMRRKQEEEYSKALLGVTNYLLNKHKGEVALLEADIVQLRAERNSLLGAGLQLRSDLVAERALADRLAHALRAVRSDRPTAHTDDVWSVINHALSAHQLCREALHEVRLAEEDRRE